MSDRIISATLAEMFLQAGDRWGHRPAFATRSSKGIFETISYRSWCDRSLCLATALLELGMAAREHVGLLSDNCFEWILVDAAIQFCGAADVPRASDITLSEMAYILDHADVKVVFLQNRTLLNTLESVRDQLPHLTQIILMEESEEKLPEGVLSLQALEHRGAELRAAGDRQVEERITQVQPEDLFTIIYTSGTTGTPKGVQLTHRAICSQVELIPFSLSSEERALSILPIWHSYERVFEMLMISQGACLYYTSIRQLSRDLMTVKPTVMASAPRLWEALYERIMVHTGQQSRWKKSLLKSAYWSTRQVHQAKRFFESNKYNWGQATNLDKNFWRLFHLRLSLVKICSLTPIAVRHALRWSISIGPFLLLDRLVLRKLRNIVGGSFWATISGGGALPLHIDAFFNDIGIRIFEGYGLTESAPVLAVRTFQQFVLGTVGPPLPKTEIKIIDLVTGEVLYPDPSHPHGGRGRRGEICARGPQIMKGYYKDPEGTARVLRDGWLYTGDIGMMTRDHCLKIVGRCKETIVLLSGENVEPLPLEARLLESPLIAQCMVVGQDQKHLGVLLVPSLEGFTKRGFSAATLKELLLQEEKILPIIQSEIRRLISASHGFKAFERIACWRLLPKAFEVGEELTPTYKLKRHVITDCYQELLQKMFYL